MYVDPKNLHPVLAPRVAVEIVFDGSVSEIISQMKAALGAANDAELASLLEVERSAISQWKKRECVPAKAKRKVNRLALARRDSLHSGMGLDDQLREQRHEAFAAAVARMKARADER